MKPIINTKPWPSRRHYEAEYVGAVTKTPIIFADLLVQRAKNAGVAYDLIDWDQLQGADLSYWEKVDKLEDLIGKTYTSSSAQQEMRAMVDAYESRASE